MKKDEERALLYAKRTQCCLGIFFLIPPILGVIAFVLCLFDNDGGFAKLSNLSGNWTCDWGYDPQGGGGGGMSAAPIYLGIMAFVGAYLIKDSLKYLFLKDE